MKDLKTLTEAEIQGIDSEIDDLRVEIDRIDNGTPARDLEVRRLGKKIEELLAKKGEPWEVKKIRKGDKLKHKKRGITGTAGRDEENGSVVVQQDDGAITHWAASDAEIVS